MTSDSKNFCFATLAIRKVYRDFAKRLASSINEFSPGTKLIIGTDQPKDFKDIANVIAFKHRQQSPLFPYNDKRWVIGKALESFFTVVYMDADARLINHFPDNMTWPPGMVVNHDTQRNFAEVIKKFCPQDMPLLQKAAQKIGLKSSLEEIKFPSQSYYVLTKNQGKEQDFLKNWDLLARYLEVHCCSNVSDGYPIGLAMASVGWVPISTQKFDLQTIIKPQGSRTTTRPASFSSKLILKLLYHYRLTKIRLNALKSPRFFYDF
ncbi:MAG: hypothetical protein QNJ33_12245 [Crocosphaera sp.]|nr:hypothetical protein [Crocosphaera sp.]